MAQRLILECDKCGSADGVRTMSFAFDGQGYDIEMCEACTKSARDSLVGLAKLARKAGSPPVVVEPKRGRGRPKGSKNKPKDTPADAQIAINPGSGKSATFSAVPRRIGKDGVQDAPDPAVVRAWAREQGIDMPERGRLKSDLIARFQSASTGR